MLTRGRKQLSLQEAADCMDISKKTLEDYQLQLRFGVKYKFDFLNNLDESIGRLRRYVNFEKKKRNSQRLLLNQECRTRGLQKRQKTSE